MQTIDTFEGMNHQKHIERVHGLFFFPQNSLSHFFPNNHSQHLVCVIFHQLLQYLEVKCIDFRTSESFSLNPESATDLGKLFNFPKVQLPCLQRENTRL